MEHSLHDKTEMLKSISKATQEIEFIQSNLSDFESERYISLSRRIDKLRKQIKRIDEYIEEINSLIKAAEENLDSKNTISIEAPDGYKVNLNRLRSWSKMIDKSFINDVYAQRVVIVGKCDICFLNRKREEFTKQIELLEKEMEYETGDKTEMIFNSVNNAIELLKSITQGEQFDPELKDVPEHEAVEGVEEVAVEEVSAEADAK